MSYRAILTLTLASCSILAAQGNQKQQQTPVATHEVRVEAREVVGNEKTVGAPSANNHVRSVDDKNIVGNAKTVGGAPVYLASDIAPSVETVGNSKTVGAR